MRKLWEELECGSAGEAGHDRKWDSLVTRRSLRRRNPRCCRSAGSSRRPPPAHPPHSTACAPTLKQKPKPKLRQYRSLHIRSAIDEQLLFLLTRVRTGRVTCARVAFHETVRDARIRGTVARVRLTVRQKRLSCFRQKLQQKI